MRGWPTVPSVRSPQVQRLHGSEDTAASEILDWTLDRAPEHVSFDIEMPLQERPRDALALLR